MKTCAQCGKTYGDEMLFCLDDGTTLRESSADRTTEAETVIKPAASAGSSKAVIFAISGFILLAFLLITMGIGGLLYYSTRPETASTDTNAEETRVTDPTPESIDQYYPTPSPEPKPTTAKTPDKPVKETAAKTPTPERAKPPEPKTNADGKRPRISEGVLNEKAISLPQPAYPAAARAVGVSGTVVVQVLVGKSGNVIMASAASGPPLLRPAAVRAARRAKFAPIYISGQPVTFSGVIRYNFRL